MNVTNQGHRRDGWVYFIVCDTTNRVKIGWAMWPPSRFVEIRAMCPTDLRLVTAVPGTIEDEHDLHRRFHALRVRHEWFRIHARLRRFINKTLARVGPEPWSWIPQPATPLQACQDFSDPQFREQLAAWHAEPKLIRNPPALDS